MDIIKDFEERVRQDLTVYLSAQGVLDKRVPECPDVEERWGEICRAYLPDGIREYQDYPVVSLGWIMFIGMAMAFYWDTDWENYSARKGIYEDLRSLRGFDNMDEAIVEDVLGYRDEEAERVIAIAAECAQRVLSMLRHAHVEPGTETALGCYMAALHQLYLAGMGMELNSLGYHMTQV